MNRRITRIFGCVFLLLSFSNLVACNRSTAVTSEVLPIGRFQSKSGAMIEIKGNNAVTIKNVDWDLYEDEIASLLIYMEENGTGEGELSQERKKEIRAASELDCFFEQEVVFSNISHDGAYTMAEYIPEGWSIPITIRYNSFDHSIVLCDSYYFSESK